MDERLLDNVKAAEILHVSRSFACLVMKSHDLPPVRIGSAMRVKATDFEQFIRAPELMNETSPAFVRRCHRP